MRQAFAAGLAARYSDTVTVKHWPVRAQDSGGAPASTEPITYTGVLVQRGERTARGGPAPAFDETQEQPTGGIPLFVPVAQPAAALRALVSQLAVDDEIVLGGQRYRVIDAPPAADGFRFPDRNAVNETVRFNRAFRKHLDQRQQLETDRTDALRKVMAETDRLYAVWDAVRDARCEFYYVAVRRTALKKLRELVGEEAYLAGTLPPGVPTWRFNQLK